MSTSAAASASVAPPSSSAQRAAGEAGGSGGGAQRFRERINFSLLDTLTEPPAVPTTKQASRARRAPATLASDRFASQRRQTHAQPSTTGTGSSLLPTGGAARISALSTSTPTSSAALLASLQSDHAFRAPPAVDERASRGTSRDSLVAACSSASSHQRLYCPSPSPGPDPWQAASDEEEAAISPDPSSEHPSGDGATHCAVASSLCTRDSLASLSDSQCDEHSDGNLSNDDLSDAATQPSSSAASTMWMQIDADDAADSQLPNLEPTRQKAVSRGRHAEVVCSSVEDRVESARSCSQNDVSASSMDTPPHDDEPRELQHNDEPRELQHDDLPRNQRDATSECEPGCDSAQSFVASAPAHANSLLSPLRGCEYGLAALASTQSQECDTSFAFEASPSPALTGRYRRFVRGCSLESEGSQNDPDAGAAGSDVGASAATDVDGGGRYSWNVADSLLSPASNLLSPMPSERRSAQQPQPRHLRRTNSFMCSPSPARSIYPGLIPRGHSVASRLLSTTPLEPLRFASSPSQPEEEAVVSTLPDSVSSAGSNVLTAAAPSAGAAGIDAEARAAYSPLKASRHPFAHNPYGTPPTPEPNVPPAPNNHHHHHHHDGRRRIPVVLMDGRVEMRLEDEQSESDVETASDTDTEPDS